MTRLFSVCCLLLLSASYLTAQKYSNEFLTIGVGARAHGMGHTQVAVVDDVTAGYWNPAGLTRHTRGLQVSAMHAEWFGGVGNYDYLALATPINGGKQTVGISAVRFGVDGIPNTLSLYDSDGTVNYDNITEFSEADYAFLLSYAQPLKLGEERELHIGGNVKVIHRVIGKFADAWGFGIDLGAQYRTGNWQFGLVARDLTNTFNAWNFTFTEEEKDQLAITGNEIPINSVELTRPQVALGAAYKSQFGKLGLLTAVDLVATTDGQRNTLVSADPISLDPTVGVELDYNQRVFLRGGLYKAQRELDFDNQEYLTADPTLGVGIALRNLRIDYAFSDVGDSDRQSYSHIVSLRITFEPKSNKQQ